MTKVLEFLNILTNNNYEYIGLVCNVIYDEVKRDGAKILSSTLLNTKKIKDIYDINIRYTFVENSNVFVNIMLQNARIFKTGINMEQPGVLIPENQTAESIGAVIDVNDRYGFNSNAAYKSDSAKLKVLLDSMSNIINNKLHNLIERGEY